MSLPSWAERMMRREVGHGDVDMLVTALSIAFEVLDEIDNDCLMVQEGSDPSAWAEAAMDRCKEAIRRIEELGGKL